MKHEKGFTLAEIIITLLIITSGTYALITLLANSQNQLQISKKRGGAMDLSNNIAETLQHKLASYGINSIDSGTDTIEYNNTRYSRQWSIFDTLLPDTKQLDISVSWGDQNSINQTLYLTPLSTGSNPQIP